MHRILLMKIRTYISFYRYIYFLFQHCFVAKIVILDDWMLHLQINKQILTETYISNVDPTEIILVANVIKYLVLGTYVHVLWQNAPSWSLLVVCLIPCGRL